MAPAGAVAGDGHELAAAVVVRPVRAGGEVDVPIEPERRQLHQGVALNVAGEERLDHQGLAGQALERLGGARHRPAASAEVVGPAGHRHDELLVEALEQRIVGVDPGGAEHVEGDLEVGPAGERDHLGGRRAGHRLERLEERVASDPGGLHQRAVDVPQDEPGGQAAFGTCCPTSPRIRNAKKTSMSPSTINQIPETTASTPMESNGELAPLTQETFSLRQSAKAGGAQTRAARLAKPRARVK